MPSKQDYYWTTITYVRFQRFSCTTVRISLRDDQVTFQYPVMLELILGNSNKKFSGVTSTMLQLLPHQSKQMELAVLGKHHLPNEVRQIGFLEAVRLSKKPSNRNSHCIFHARRNDEMIQALILKKILRAQIKIAFTSTAQRHHSKFTKYLIRQMDGVITTSKYAGAYLETPADVTIPHGIDHHTYTPADNKSDAWQALGLSGKFGIGMFGRVREQKGLDLLVDAAIPLFKENPDPTIVVVGGQPVLAARKTVSDLNGGTPEPGIRVKKLQILSAF